MYDSPIIIAEMNNLIDQEISDKCIKIAMKYSIDIDERKLIAALKADGKRYEEAYQKGFQDGKISAMNTIRHLDYD